jgi:hypothetical protein
MDESLQKILGVEKVDDPMLPGTRPRDTGKVIYVFLPPDSDPSDAFREVTGKIDPPIPKAGAALMEHWQVETPNGEKFYSLYFHGDVEGWRQQIELGAHQLGLQMAKVRDDKFMVLDGSTFLLSDCAVTFNGSRFLLPGQ